MSHPKIFDTAEEAAKAFMDAWLRSNFVDMYAACQITWKYNRPIAGTPPHGPNGVEFLLGIFADHGIITYGPLEKDPTPNAPRYVADFIVPVVYETAKPGGVTQAYRYLRVIRETAPYRPGDGLGASWGVNPLSAMREKKD